MTLTTLFPYSSLSLFHICRTKEEKWKWNSHLLFLLQVIYIKTTTCFSFYSRSLTNFYYFYWIDEEIVVFCAWLVFQRMSKWTTVGDWWRWMKTGDINHWQKFMFWSLSTAIRARGIFLYKISLFFKVNFLFIF